ncbi:hypothetical protein Fmac_025079 [Flemingia macrophylla]|uniref:Secreted protein n=1 Tax=Flemingia macrophylla TaxID=520843 RepID=A0ABD1LR77_9FABA
MLTLLFSFFFGRVVVNRPFSELLCGFMKDGIFVEGSSEDSAVGISGLMLCSRRSVATIQSKVLLKYQNLKFCSFSFSSPHAPNTGWVLISSKIKKGSCNVFASFIFLVLTVKCCCS